MLQGEGESKEDTWWKGLQGRGEGGGGGLFLFQKKKKIKGSYERKVDFLKKHQLRDGSGATQKRFHALSFLL
jgi:hypothetical protein